MTSAATAKAMGGKRARKGEPTRTREAALPRAPRMTHRRSHYAGLRAKFRKTKYGECEYRAMHGGSVRMLSPREIAEFREHIDARIMALASNPAVAPKRGNRPREATLADSDAARQFAQSLSELIQAPLRTGR